MLELCRCPNIYGPDCRYRKNETPLPVRCKHFANLWPTVDLCSSKMMIAEVLHQHVLYCDFTFRLLQEHWSDETKI